MTHRCTCGSEITSLSLFFWESLGDYRLPRMDERSGDCVRHGDGSIHFSQGVLGVFFGGSEG